jgi:hypothetical protein
MTPFEACPVMRSHALISMMAGSTSSTSSYQRPDISMQDRKPADRSRRMAGPYGYGMHPLRRTKASIRSRAETAGRGSGAVSHIPDWRLTGRAEPMPEMTRTTRNGPRACRESSGENYSGISRSLPARSYASSISRTARAQSCTLIGGGAPRRQWSSASRTAMK